MLREKIKADADQALRNHEPKLVEVLRFLISLIDKKELQLPPNQMTEAEEVAVLRKELKNKEEAKELFRKGGREDLVADLENEIAIVKKYLPEELSEDEVRKIVEETEGNNFGMVMGAVMKKVAGRVGGDVVSKLVKEKLG